MTTKKVAIPLLAVIFLVAIAANQKDSPLGEPSLKADAPQVARDYLDASIKLRKKHREGAADDFKEAKADLARIKSMPVVRKGYIPGVNFPDAKTKKKEVDEAIERLREATDYLAQVNLPTYLPEPTIAGGEKGDVGRMKFRVRKIIDDNQMVVEVGQDARTVWLSGIPTEGLADEDEAAAVVEIVGTKKYQETRTIVNAKAFDINKYLE